MSLPLLFAGLVLVAASYLARRYALARRTIAIGAASSGTVPERLFLGEGGARPRPVGIYTAEGWQVLFVRQLHAAEELLDCLEACGITEIDFDVLGPSAFAVRWRAAERRSTTDWIEHSRISPWGSRVTRGWPNSALREGAPHSTGTPPLTATIGSRAA